MDKVAREIVFMVSLINKHQNNQWLQCHSVSCARLLNISLNMEVYLYDLRMCDRDYGMSWARYYDILVYTTNYYVTTLVGLSKSFYNEMSHSVGEMKCRSRNANHDFFGLKSHL